MGKYRKKPVVIEAFQITLDSYNAYNEWPNWLKDAWSVYGEGHNEEGGVWEDDNGIWCGTLEGVHRVAFGDFIIQGVQGELYPCKPDIFEKTYEPVEG